VRDDDDGVVPAERDGLGKPSYGARDGLKLPEAHRRLLHHPPVSFYGARDNQNLHPYVRTPQDPS
jgi:hypothetical protein